MTRIYKQTNDEQKKNLYTQKNYNVKKVMWTNTFEHIGFKM